MRTIDVAQGMNMALRSYEHFESGAGRINIERIHRFAEVTDSDPHGRRAGVSASRRAAFMLPPSVGPRLARDGRLP